MSKIKSLDAVNVAKRLVSAYQQWFSQDGPHVNWNNQMVKGISEQLDIAIRGACDDMADAGSEVDEKARAIVLCFDDIADSYLQWIQDASMQLPSAPPGGSTDLRNNLERLQKLLEAERLPKPEPIAQLIARRVSPNQIAIIYGWKLEDGSPDCQKVFEETESPGTHYDPEKWQHPALRAMQRETDEAWKQRSPRAKMFAHLDQPEQTGPAENHVPSLDELFAARAPKAQIMRLHHLSDEEVEFHAQERGLVEFEDRFIMPANATVAHQERMAEQEQIERDVAAVASGSSGGGTAVATKGKR
ncbi:MAG: hypothetical protein IT422_05020 [Pirellulaceae bacterium]|nr:hypothetical protein [Pirellulaceae bacterium]